MSDLMDENWFNKGIAVVVLLAIATVIFGVLGCIAMSILADGKVAYCYISYTSPNGLPPVYQLKGFRPWCPDSTIVTKMNFDEAVQAANEIHCALMTQK